MEHCLASDESRVLIIYTGGTIGMLIGDHGYVPEPYFLTETLRSQARFHDPLQESLFSHSSTVEDFRQWSSSGRATPSNDDFADSVSVQSTLLVRSSRPIHAPPALSPATVPARTQTIKVADDVYESRVPALVTPRGIVSGGDEKRIRYAVLEVPSMVMKHLERSHPNPQWYPLLDSSNIEIDGRACPRSCS
jgi:lysophospholipase